MRTLVFLLGILSFSCAAQTTKKGTIRVKKPAASDSVYTIVQQMPEYPGGYNAMIYYVQRSVRYPASAIEKGLQGTVFLTFIVNADGSISDACIVKGVPACPECDAEALRMVKTLPFFRPGFNNGNAVRTKFNLPVKFSLR
jgi:protein TonB